MCLIAMAWGVSQHYPLVIAANRDEFYTRPTAPLAQWTTPAGHTIVGGRDLQDGGTWLGFTPNGRFAMLTNVRNPAAALPPQPRSRGALVVDWLASPLDAAAWSRQLALPAYAGFNLIFGNWAAQQCHYLSNQSLQPSPKNLLPNRPAAQYKQAQAATENIANSACQAVPSGRIHGLSNAALNTPWPKTVQLVGALEGALGSHEAVDALQARLLHALQSDSPASLAQMPRTGVPLAQEQALSSVFVRYPNTTPSYGTRTSLVAVLDAQQQLHLIETTHASASQSALTLAWPGV
jgi:uncharacterized protein with NRDE domain